MSRSSVTVDRTVLYSPYKYLMWFFFAVLAAYVAWSWQAYIAVGDYQTLGFLGAMQALLFWYMVNTYTCRTEYRLEKDELVIVIDRKFKGVKEIRLGYGDIFGVYDMKKENRKSIETAPAYYAYSRLDKRKVWVLLYNYNDDTKKAGRILMKASDEFWDAFRAVLPDQICVPQAEVLGYAYKHMGEVLRRKEEKDAEDEGEVVYEYVDEDGNRIDEEAVKDQEYEIVDEDAPEEKPDADKAKTKK